MVDVTHSVMPLHHLLVPVQIASGVSYVENPVENLLEMAGLAFHEMHLERVGGGVVLADHPHSACCVVVVGAEYVLT